MHQGRLLTHAELDEIDVRADLDQALIQQRRVDRVQLRRAVKDRALLLGHIWALEEQRLPVLVCVGWMNDAGDLHKPIGHINQKPAGFNKPVFAAGE